MIDLDSGACFLHALVAILLCVVALGFSPVVMATESGHNSTKESDEVLKSAISLFNLGKFRSVITKASVALSRADPGGEKEIRSKFLRALACIRAGLPSDPSDWISVMSSKEKGLAAHAAWYLGLDLWKRGKKQGTKKAFDLAGPYLEKVTVPGRFGLDASSKITRGMLASAKPRQACHVATAVAKAYYRKRAEPQALWLLASCLQRAGWMLMRLGDKPLGRDYLTHSAQLSKMITIMWSEHWTAPMAARSLRALRKSGFKPGRLPLGPLMERARDLVNHRRYTKDMTRLWRIRKLLARGVKDAAGAELELLWAKMSLSRRRFRSAWRAACRIVRRANDVEMKAKAALVKAQIIARRSRTRAIKSYLDLVKRWPETSAASRALYMAGELTRRGGDMELAHDLFLRCIRDFGDSPHAGSCRWGLAWTYYLQGQLEPALEWLAPLSEQDELLVDAEPLAGGQEPEKNLDNVEAVDIGADEDTDSDEGDGDDGQDVSEEEIDEFDHRGVRLSEMALYWTARIHQRLSHQHSAEQLYSSLVNDHPFSYYSIMAWARLAQMGNAPALELEPQDKPEPGELSPEVAAAVTYYTMGLWGEARATLFCLSRHDLVSPNDRRWAAWVYDGLGIYVRSHRMAPVPMRGGLPDYSEQAWRFDARLAFPRAFSRLVQEAATGQSVPPSLMYSLIRAESGFWPKAHSAAHARGLTQVIYRTAAAMARRLKIKRFRSWKLYNPQMSIRIGAAYLSLLLSRYENPALAIAAYNAGEPSVNRWLALRGQMQLDEFIEEIPYAETSRYTRKVMSWWAIYRVLYENDIKLPLEVKFSLR